MSGARAGGGLSQEATSKAFLVLGPAGFTPVELRVVESGRLAVEPVGDRSPDALPPVLAGFVNAHSHAFQRLLRGRSESRGGDFWSWRERMYQVALRLEPDDVRVASRAAFLEMLLAGCTSVVEFHYLHHDRSGRPYGDPNAMAEAVLEAAAEVGIRIRFLTTAYARGGPGRDLDEAQRRFADPSPEAFLARADALRSRLARRGPLASFGLALHSVRALPREWLEELAAWGDRAGVPVHAHVSEQTSEVDACVAEHGLRPVELLDRAGVLGPRFTAVHAVHVTDEEIGLLAASGAAVCACPSTEANLGDGFVPAARLLASGVPLALGSDSHAAIDLFAEARELDYRERLRSGNRRGLAGADRLLEIASEGGARSAGWASGDATGASADAPVGRLENGWAADFVVLDAEHPALAGSDPDSLAETLLVAGSPGLVREVWVAGVRVVEGGRHPRQDEILADLRSLQRRLWSE